MNNAYLKSEDEPNDEDTLPILRERAEHLTEIIEALQNIAGSSYWHVLKQYVFDVDLDKARRRLAKEENTTKIFRLQGNLEWASKFDLEKLSHQYRNELQTIRKKIV